MLKQARLALFAAFVLAASDVSAATVTVQGRNILVDGAQFTVKGVCYSPVPAGSDWSFKWVDFPDIYNSDLPLIKSMGANTIRTYHERNISRAFLDSAHQNGLRVIVGWGENLWGKDFSDPAARLQQVNDFAAFINTYKDHPAVLLWSFGNEVEEHLAAPYDKASWYTLLSEAAAKAHLTDPAHPVTTANQEISEIGNASLNASDANAVDVWGINVYRGQGLSESFFTEISTRTTKPFFLSEWGCDAYGTAGGSEDQAMQDKYIRGQWSGIGSNLISSGKNCSGGTVFEWCDEWWKGVSVPGDISTLGQGGRNGNAYQDTDQDWSNTAYAEDTSMNEEWWGLVSISAGSAVRRPRSAYYSLRELWNPGWDAASSAALSAIMQGDVRSYPNPFLAGRDTARIEVSVSGSPGIEMTVFDLYGNELVKLDNIIDLGSGIRAADWNGRRGDGSLASAGLYICRVKARTADREEVKYRKIAVVK